MKQFEQILLFMLIFFNKIAQVDTIPKPCLNTLQDNLESSFVIINFYHVLILIYTFI
jgi:hypothetical protein